MGDEDDQMSISPDFVKSLNQHTKLTFETTYEFKPQEFAYDIWDGKTGVDTRYVDSIVGDPQPCERCNNSSLRL